jgi:ABC-type proline/glycine betaine transport system ATPase subunit
MRKGKVIQIDEADKVYSAPSDEYIKTLIDSIPS